MKKLLLSLSIFAIGIMAAQAASPTYLTDYDYARNLSKSTGKPLLITFYGKW